TLLVVVVPLPSCPLALLPQAIALPPLSRARLCVAPAAIALTPLRPPTATGVTSPRVKIPLPTCPCRSSPHAITVPPLSSARLCLPPAATAVTPLRPLPPTGALLATIVPLPSCPSALFPHAATPAGVSTAPAGTASVTASAAQTAAI